MSIVQLAELVVQCRVAQTAYFRSHQIEHLEMARRLEKELDAACNEILSPSPGLFDIDPNGPDA